MVSSGWNPTQQKVIAIVPKFSAGLSLVGSSCIIYEVLVFDRRKLRRVYHRLLLTMSIYDVIESSLNFCSTWPIPRGTEGVAFASGTTLTCGIQGFILQFGLAIPILNMCLSIYYLLVIKFSWSEAQIKQTVEPWFHAVALIVSLAFCIASAIMQLYNNANLWCWIAPLPLDCLDTYSYGDEGNCIRGDNAWIYRWAFYYAELWFCILFVMFAMLAVYYEVRRLEHANHRHDFERRKRLKRQRSSFSERSTELPRQSKSRQVATQALWYVGAFYLTFLFATINRLIQQIAGQTYFALTLLHTIFEPSQGFLNYCVYIRPRYVNFREKHPSVSRLGALKQVIFPAQEGRSRSENSNFVDDIHESEELAKNELKRWRRKPARSSGRASGVLRFVPDKLESFGDTGSTVHSTVLSRGRGESNIPVGCFQESEVDFTDDGGNECNVTGENYQVTDADAAGGGEDNVDQDISRKITHKSVSFNLDTT